MNASPIIRSTARGATVLSLVAVALVAALLLASGVALRVAGANRAGTLHKTPLLKSFDEFPLQFLGYQWRRDKLDEATEKVAGADAYLKLDGVRPGDAFAVDLYATYVGGGATLLEHEPQVCYLAQGWTLPYGIKQTLLDLPARDGRPAGKLPINIYVFEQDFSYRLVINYYCVNWNYFNNRTEVRLMGNEPGGFYLQTRVTLPLSDADLLGCTPDNVVEMLEKSPRFQQAIEVLRFAAPQLEGYLPLRSAAGQGAKE